MWSGIRTTMENTKMKTNKPLLITGGCGFIGSNLVRHCLMGVMSDQEACLCPSGLPQKRPPLRYSRRNSGTLSAAPPSASTVVERVWLQVFQPKKDFLPVRHARAPGLRSSRRNSGTLSVLYPVASLRVLRLRCKVRVHKEPDPDSSPATQAGSE